MDKMPLSYLYLNLSWEYSEKHETIILIIKSMFPLTSAISGNVIFLNKVIFKCYINQCGKIFNWCTKYKISEFISVNQVIQNLFDKET